MDEFLRAKALYPVNHTVRLQLSTVSESEFYEDSEENGYVNHPGGRQGRKMKFLVSATSPRVLVIKVNGNCTLEFSPVMKISALQEKERKPTRMKGA